MPSFDPKNITKIHQHLHSHLPSDPALRVKALETILVEKGLVNSENIARWVEDSADEVGPKRGAHLVASAGIESDSQVRLLEDSSKDVDAMGYAEPAQGKWKAIEKRTTGHQA